MLIHQKIQICRRTAWRARLEPRHVGMVVIVFMRLPQLCLLQYELSRAAIVGRSILLALVLTTSLGVHEEGNDKTVQT